MPNTTPEAQSDGQTAAQPRIKPLPTPEEFAAFMRGEPLPQPQPTTTTETAIVEPQNPGPKPKAKDREAAVKDPNANQVEPGETTASGDEEESNFKPMPYPKNGEVHVRFREEEWTIIQRICKRRNCSLANALNFILRYFDHYPTDLEAAIDYLEVFDLHTDIIEAQVEDLVESAHRIEQLLRVETTGAAPPKAAVNGNNGAPEKGT